MIQEHVENAKHVVDGLSIATTFAAIMTWVPHMAAFLSLIWAGFRVYNAYLDMKIKKKELNK